MNFKIHQENGIQNDERMETISINKRITGQIKQRIQKPWQNIVSMFIMVIKSCGETSRRHMSYRDKTKLSDAIDPLWSWAAETAASWAHQEIFHIKPIRDGESVLSKRHKEILIILLQCNESTGKVSLVNQGFSFAFVLWSEPRTDPWGPSEWRLGFCGKDGGGYKARESQICSLEEMKKGN